MPPLPSPARASFAVLFKSRAVFSIDHLSNSALGVAGQPADSTLWAPGVGGWNLLPPIWSRQVGNEDRGQFRVWDDRSDSGRMPGGEESEHQNVRQAYQSNVENCNKSGRCRSRIVHC